MHFLLWLAILVGVTSLVSSQSTTKLGNFLWDLYLKFSSNSTVLQVKSTRKRLAEVKLERSSTSSKDEFAKWARLDREHRKLKSEIDVCNATLAQTRQNIQQATRVIKWCATSGVKLVVQWRYRKAPVIVLPRNVLPRPVEWFLSLPSAPMGTISVATWIAITSTGFGAFLTQGKVVLGWLKSFKAKKAKA